MLRLIRNQSGETIVEVLIALSILGLVLGAGYASASDSIRTAQDTQERIEASQFARGMVESIKYIANQPSYQGENLLFPPGPAGTSGGQRDFCITEGNLGDPSSTLDNKPATPANPAAAPGCYKGPDNRYYSWVDVQRTEGTGSLASSTGPSRYTYVATVQWEGISGNENQLVYRYKWTVIND
jgi:prepilin-type N-terminal cleavage/methylation domain-containing protein